MVGFTSMVVNGYHVQKDIVYIRINGQIKEIFYRRHQYYKKEMDKLSEEGNEISAKTLMVSKTAYKIYDNLKNITLQKTL